MLALRPALVRAAEAAKGRLVPTYQCALPCKGHHSRIRHSHAERRQSAHPSGIPGPISGLLLTLWTLEVTRSCSSAYCNIFEFR